MTSIIIPTHNDFEFLSETIKSIRQTVCCDVELIVVNDGGKRPDVRADVILDKKRGGIGAAYDYGIKHAEGDIVVLADCDLRFTPGWLDRFIETLDTYPESLVCGTCLEYDIFNRNIEKPNERYGANIWEWYPSQYNGITFKMPLKTDWNYHKKGDIFPVDSVLGGCYAVRKDWFNKCLAHKGHYIWGGRDALISLRTWIMGGQCLCDSRAKIGHIFRRHHTHGATMKHWTYNKMLTVMTMFEGQKLRDYMTAIKRMPEFREAMCYVDYNEIELIRKYFALNRKKSQAWLYTNVIQ